MLFDPEDGMTVEQSIEIGWNKWVPPSMGARVLRLAKVTGRTRNAIILECMEMFVSQLEDEPDKRAAFHAMVEHQEAPYGLDPLLKKGAGFINFK